MFCTAKHRPILKCGKNIASILTNTQATSSTSKLCVLPLEPPINTGCQLRSSDSQRKWRCLKGAVLNIKLDPFYIFSRVFFTPLRYDYPFDATLVFWQYESRIRRDYCTVQAKKKLFFTFGMWCLPICALNIAD